METESLVGMSREHVRIGATEVLGVIKKSQLSLADSMEKGNTEPFDTFETEDKINDKKTANEKRWCNCIGKQDTLNQEVNELIKQREDILRKKLEEKFEREKNEMKERLDSILCNEQVRMLSIQREVQRKCQDKIDALKSQLECRNLAGLMYVMCSERTKSKIEKTKIVEEYTNHINCLQDLLVEGRKTILYLSKGYKCAARVDFEWREKMKEVVKQNFLHRYMGGPPETLYYLLDLEKLLETNAPLYPDDNADDVISEELILPVYDRAISEENKHWWETFEGDERPFVVFGDMEEMNLREKIDIKKKIKVVKTVPKQWKQYVFDDMRLKPATCENLHKVKKVSSEQRATQKRNKEPFYRQTTYNTDQGHAVGTVLKFVVSSGSTLQTAANKHTLASGILGAKDSLEIVSTMKILKERTKNDSTPSMTSCEKILLELRKGSNATHDVLLQDEEKSSDGVSSSSFMSIEDDSFRITSANMPRNESLPTFEKVCPVDQCKLMRMDSFFASLPSYMRKTGRNVDYAYEDYEPCSPEQLQIIKQRLEEEAQKNNVEEKEDVLDEWKNFVDGVGVQTSAQSIPTICTCPKQQTTQYVDRRDITDFLPMKQKLDYIPKERLFDSQVQFRRFKLVGDASDNRRDFPADQLVQDLRTIFDNHPSVMSLFNTN